MDYELCLISRLGHLEQQNFNKAEDVQQQRFSAESVCLFIWLCACQAKSLGGKKFLSCIDSRGTGDSSPLPEYASM